MYVFEKSVFEWPGYHWDRVRTARYCRSLSLIQVSRLRCAHGKMMEMVVLHVVIYIWVDILSHQHPLYNVRLVTVGELQYVITLVGTNYLP